MSKMTKGNVQDGKFRDVDPAPAENPPAAESEENPNQENSNQQQENKMKTKIRLRSPFEKVTVADPKDNGEKPKKEKNWKTRLQDFGRGVGTGVLIVGTGLVAYGKYKQQQDAERKKATNRSVDSCSDYDSEEAMLLGIPECDCDTDCPEDETEE